MKRRIALIALAVALALVGTIAVYSYVNHADKRAIAGTKAAKVLIVQKQIPVGTTWGDVVKGDYVAAESVPAESAPSNAVASLADDVPTSDVASASIAAGQIVVRPMFGERTAVTGALNIPAKKIAVSVSLPTSADVAGYVQQGSYVTVFATYKIKPIGKTSGPKGNALGGDDVYQTKTLLARTEVLAVSQAAPTGVDGSKNSSSSGNDAVIVTLAVDQREAQKLVLSQQVGQLYLGLLSETSVTKTDGGVIGATTFSPAPVTID
jgi:pilus assembly protein CpaB